MINKRIVMQNFSKEGLALRSRSLARHLLIFWSIMGNRIRDIISATEKPSTILSLAADLKKLGVKPGMVLAVHSSLSFIGYVVGGAPAVVLALENVLEPQGTLAMPTHCSDPTNVDHMGEPETWHQTIRENLPPFYPDLTMPRKDMGAIVQCFIRQNGTVRSGHPFTSWIARGPCALRITGNHELRMSQGNGSPLARLYDEDANVLLIGVDYSRATSLHLAEYRSRHSSKKLCKRKAVLEANGVRQWCEYDDISWYSEDFNEIGAAFEKAMTIHTGMVGKANCRFFSQRDLIDFAVTWMDANRK
jgi:aminoglycoside 3-N-acetyltransferase